MLVIYSWALVVLFAAAIGTAVGRKDHFEVWSLTVRLLMFVPLIGRVLGAW